jgi:3-oxoacyl-ACP reductase-like protein
MVENTGPNRAQENRAVTQRASMPTPVRTSAMVESITTAFGLNRSQAADVLRVRRQTIYNWLNGAESEGGNLARIQAIYDLVGSIPAFVDPVMAIRKTPDGSSSLLEMLSAERLDKSAILSWVETLGKPVRHRRAPLLSDILREAGIPRNEEAERRRLLDGISHHQG